MKSLILKLIFAFVFSCTIIFTFAQNHAANHSEAVELCANDGNLVANHYFPRVDVSLTDFGPPRVSVRYSQLTNVELEDGASAWVAGYARYGDSMYNHWGCYQYDNQNTFAVSDNQGHRGFYQCSEYCENEASGTSYYRNFYLLINTTSCVCLKNVDTSKRTACPETNEDRLLLELYWRRKRDPYEGIYQCGTLRYNNNKHKWETLTSKCLGNKHVLCTHIKQSIVCNNSTLVENPYCDVGISGTWMNGVKKCNYIEGMLAPYPVKVMPATMHWDNQYWLGTAGAYKIQTQRGDACLSVTRLGDQLILEPDDCKTKNKFICASDIKPNNGGNTAKYSLPNTPINAQTTHPYAISTSVNSSQSSPSNKQTTNFNVIPASTSSLVISTTLKVSITRPMASSVGTNTVLIIVVCCSVVVVGGGVATAFVICRRKRQSINDCNKHVMTQSSSNTCITDNSKKNIAESDYATVDETNLVQAKSDAATVPPGNLLNLTASGGTRDKNTPQEKQTRNTLTRKNNVGLCENIPHSNKALDNRNKDENDTDASMSDEYNVLSFNNPARAARKREDSEAHVYDHMPAIRIGQRSDEKHRNESHKEDENEYDTTESVQVLLHGGYATTRSLRKADYGEYDTSQSLQDMLRSNQQTDDTYNHIPNALYVAKAEDELKKTHN